MAADDNITENDRYCLIHLAPIYPDEVEAWRWARKDTDSPDIPNVTPRSKPGSPWTWYYSREEALANRPEDFWS